MIPPINRNKLYEQMYVDAPVHVRAEMDNAAVLAQLAAGKLQPVLSGGRLQYVNPTGFGNKIVQPAALRDLDMKMDEVVTTLAMLVIENGDWIKESFDHKSFSITLALRWIKDADYRSRIVAAIPAQLNLDTKFSYDISGDMIIISGDFVIDCHYTSMLELLEAAQACSKDEVKSEHKRDEVKRDPREEYKKR